MPEEIIAQLRQADVLIAQGQSVAEAMGPIFTHATASPIGSLTV